MNSPTQLEDLLRLLGNGYVCILYTTSTPATIKTRADCEKLRNLLAAKIVDYEEVSFRHALSSWFESGVQRSLQHSRQLILSELQVIYVMLQIDLASHPSEKASMVAVSGMSSLPQVQAVHEDGTHGKVSSIQSWLLFQAF